MLMFVMYVIITPDLKVLMGNVLQIAAAIHRGFSKMEPVNSAKRMRSFRGMDLNACTALSREKMENVDVKMLQNLCLLARSNVIAPKDSHMIE